ncbi:MAG: hypothetical protein AAF790_04940, partial [Planctomycetota bacterium]
MRQTNFTATPTRRVAACLAALGVAAIAPATGGHAAAAQDVRVEADGKTITVGPDHGAGGVTVTIQGAEKIEAAGGQAAAPVQGGPAPAMRIEAAAQPGYWVGIVGGELSEELRAHLKLEGPGVIIREVV